MAEFVSIHLYGMYAQLNAGKIPESIPAPVIVASTPSHLLSFHLQPVVLARLVPEDTEKLYMLPRLLAYRYPTGETMPEYHVISECMGHMVAGTDTTSISLSYFLWELVRRHNILRKLQNEIDAVMPDTNTIPDIKSRFSMT
ncbi:hypothetical protein C8R47DRAFT_1230928 [Mycena vitilis]|nr:hypothetical protein C8R47DRAFT_1230928 [Mycena vitilis]